MPNPVADTASSLLSVLPGRLVFDSLYGLISKLCGGAVILLLLIDVFGFRLDILNLSGWLIFKTTLFNDVCLLIILLFMLFCLGILGEFGFDFTFQVISGLVRLGVLATEKVKKLSAIHFLLSVSVTKFIYPKSLLNSDEKTIYQPYKLKLASEIPNFLKTNISGVEALSLSRILLADKNLLSAHQEKAEFTFLRCVFSSLLIVMLKSVSNNPTLAFLALILLVFTFLKIKDSRSEFDLKVLNKIHLVIVGLSAENEETKNKHSTF